jgi:serine/threonine protein kinase
MSSCSISNTIPSILVHYYLIVVGDGAYGCVIRAEDTSLPKRDNMVAIKKIEKAFDHRLYAKRTLRELKILRLIKHENVNS